MHSYQMPCFPFFSERHEMNIDYQTWVLSYLYESVYSNLIFIHVHSFVQWAINHFLLRLCKDYNCAKHQSWLPHGIYFYLRTNMWTSITLHVHWYKVICLLMNLFHNKTYNTHAGFSLMFTCSSISIFSANNVMSK
mgnify:CR=1 FL=1